MPASFSSPLTRLASAVVATYTSPGPRRVDSRYSILSWVSMGKWPVLFVLPLLCPLPLAMKTVEPISSLPEGALPNSLSNCQSFSRSVEAETTPKVRLGRSKP